MSWLGNDWLIAVWCGYPIYGYGSVSNIIKKFGSLDGEICFDVLPKWLGPLMIVWAKFSYLDWQFSISNFSSSIIKESFWHGLLIIDSSNL